MNNPFTFEETLVLQLYKTESRVDLITTLQELFPFVVDDEEITSLLSPTIHKLESLSDSEFNQLTIEDYNFEEENFDDEYNPV